VLYRTSEATNPEVTNDGGPDDYSLDTGQNRSAEDFSLKKAFC
jgi:hypothetical protein